MKFQCKDCRKIKPMKQALFTQPNFFGRDNNIVILCKECFDKRLIK